MALTHSTRYINIYRPALDIGVVCYLVRRLCVIIVFSWIQHKEGSLHSAILPRRWLVDHLPEFKSSEYLGWRKELPFIAVYCSHVTGIVDSVHDGHDTGNLSSPHRGWKTLTGSKEISSAEAGTSPHATP
jgi:hypothetical protein